MVVVCLDCDSGFGGVVYCSDFEVGLVVWIFYFVCMFCLVYYLDVGSYICCVCFGFLLLCCVLGYVFGG